jgi:hypothetical protein
LGDLFCETIGPQMRQQSMPDSLDVRDVGSRVERGWGRKATVLDWSSRTTPSTRVIGHLRHSFQLLEYLFGIRPSHMEKGCSINLGA